MAVANRRMPTTRQTIELMEAASRAVLDTADGAGLERDTCITHVRMLQIALSEHGVPCRPLPLRVTVMDPRAAQIYRDSYAAGNDPPIVDGGIVARIGYMGHSDEEKWDGHLALAVRQRFILDLSLDQVKLRHPGLDVPRLLATDAPMFLTGKQTIGEFPLPSGGLVVYEHHHDCDPWLPNESWDQLGRDKMIRQALRNKTRAWKGHA